MGEGCEGLDGRKAEIGCWIEEPSRQHYVRKRISEREKADEKCCTMQERQKKWNILTSSSCSFWCFRCFHWRWICCAATCLRNSSTRLCVSCSNDVTDDERLWNVSKAKNNDLAMFTLAMGYLNSNLFRYLQAFEMKWFGRIFEDFIQRA